MYAIYIYKLRGEKVAGGVRAEKGGGGGERKGAHIGRFVSALLTAAAFFATFAGALCASYRMWDPVARCF